MHSPTSLTRRPFALKSLLSAKAAAILALVPFALSPSAGAASLLYQYAFDGGAGANIGSLSGGDLSLTNSSSGGVAFSGSGGVLGGALNATSGQTYNASNPAGAATGTLSGLGTMNAITVTMWVKLSASALNNFGRLFVLGANDVGATNSIAMSLNGAGKLNLYLNSSDTTNMTNLGPALTADTWYFIAISYDGSSVTSTNSAVQSVATGGADARNGQLYVGTVADPVARTGVKVGQGLNYNDSRGSIAFSSVSASYVANRSDLTRGVVGEFDDIRVYDGVLTASEVEGVRVMSSSIPEAGSTTVFAAVAAMGFAGACVRRR